MEDFEVERNEDEDFQVDYGEGEAFVELARGMEHRLIYLFNRLEECWPTLGLKWHPTDKSIERKGDVIEIAIVLSREAHALPGRQECLSLISEYHACMVRILKIVST